MLRSIKRSIGLVRATDAKHQTHPPVHSHPGGRPLGGLAGQAGVTVPRRVMVYLLGVLAGLLSVPAALIAGVIGILVPLAAVGVFLRGRTLVVEVLIGAIGGVGLGLVGRWRDGLFRQLCRNTIMFTRALPAQPGAVGQRRMWRCAACPVANMRRSRCPRGADGLPCGGETQAASHPLAPRPLIRHPHQRPLTWLGCSDDLDGDDVELDFGLGIDLVREERDSTAALMILSSSVVAKLGRHR